MQTQRRAVIDIGTNSVKVLVAEVAGCSVEPVLEESHQTRLGQGFYSAHSLQPERIEATAQAVAEFVTKARQHNAATIRIIATSAAREARNADQLSKAVLNAAGLPVEIISGETEAEMAFRGISTEESLNGPPVLLLEVGGGSTQFIVGHNGRPHFLESLPIGTVRLAQKLPHSDPPKVSELKACRDWLHQYLASALGPKLRPALDREQSACGAGNPFRLVATGGTASILGCMEARLTHFDRAALEATRLPRSRVEWHVQRLWSLPLVERKEIVGLPKNRADIILNGAAIYEAAMRELRFDELRISTRGLRFGALVGGPHSKERR